MNQDCLVIAVITKSLEEDPPSQERYLKRLDVDVNSMYMPCPESKKKGDESGKDSIEVEEEEEGSGNSQ